MTIMECFWMITTFAMVFMCIYINESWYKECMEMNNDWHRFCKKIIEDAYKGVTK